VVPVPFFLSLSMLIARAGCSSSRSSCAALDDRPHHFGRKGEIPLQLVSECRYVTGFPFSTRCMIVVPSGSSSREVPFFPSLIPFPRKGVLPFSQDVIEEDFPPVGPSTPLPDEMFVELFSRSRVDT